MSGPHSPAEGIARFERIAIVGLGLLGGSVALAARERGLAGTIVAAGRRRAPLEEALSAGIVDAIGSLEEMVVGADLVVLGAPVDAMAPALEKAAPHLAPAAIVTDVGSVKAVLAETLPGLLPDGVHYVGAHPMAGSHLKGACHSTSDLFVGATCAVTPHAGCDARSRARVEAFWEALGARVVVRDPAAHDLEVAWTSHAPHLIAYAFASALRKAPPETGVLAGGGFRDFTRIARSDAELWGGILLENRKPLAGVLEAFGEAMNELSQRLDADDGEALERSLASARDALATVARRAEAAGSSDDAEDA